MQLRRQEGVFRNRRVVVNLLCRVPRQDGTVSTFPMVSLSRRCDAFVNVNERSFSNVVSDSDFEFDLIKMLCNFPRSLLFIRGRKSAVVRVGLVFHVFTLSNFLSTLLVVSGQKVRFSSSTVTSTRYSARNGRTVMVFGLLDGQSTFLSSFCNFSRLSRIYVYNRLLTNGPATDNIKAIRVRYTICRGGNLFLVAVDVVISNFRGRKVYPLLIFTTIPLADNGGDSK